MNSAELFGIVLISLLGVFLLGSMWIGTLFRWPRYALDRSIGIAVVVLVLSAIGCFIKWFMLG